MTCLLITYDLNSPGQDYKGLHEAIKGLGHQWLRVLDSTWLITTRLTPGQAWDQLDGIADTNDSFLILDITGDSSNGWLPTKSWEWIQSNV